MGKIYSNGSELNKKILEGINELADNVASTLGPRGRNVILHRKGSSPIITKDGVTVAEFVEFDDPIKNTGAQILKQASSQTNTNAGDGTTTATVLARAILNQAQKYLVAGSSPTEIKRGMDKAVAAIIEKLQDGSKEITSLDDIEHIATISANGDTVIGKLIATAVDQVGKDGSVTVQDAKSVDTSLELVEGFRFDSGYAASAFINEKRRGIVSYEDFLILVTDHKVETVDQILPVLEIVARESRPFIIIADEIEGQALAALIMNTVRGTMKVAAVKAPRYGEERRNILSDFALSVGATYVTRESAMPLKDITLEHLGRAKKVEVGKYNTTVLGGHGDYNLVESRVEEIKAELVQTEDLDACEKLQERITRLASGIAIIKVGGATEIEMTERRYRIEDALEAVKAAQAEGMLPGGGVALVRAAHDLDVEVENADQGMGVDIVKQAVCEPLRQMAKNAGESPDLIQNLVESEHGSFGYNFATNNMVDMYEVGIVDPLKVTRSALQNATSVSSTLITTSCAIVED